jgi:uncharacterized protein DUF6983
MSTVALPFVPSVANYRVATTLSDRVYLFDVRWNTREGVWYFNILSEDETMLSAGNKIVLGACLAGRSVNHDLPPGIFLAQDLAGLGQDATFDDIGTRVQIFYYPFEDFGSAVDEPTITSSGFGFGHFGGG